MIKDEDLETLARRELKTILPNLIIKNDRGEYEIFTKYKIVPTRPTYQVWVYSTCVGEFNSTKTALSWCIADKYQKYNLARDLLNTDQLLGNISNDIFVRAGIAQKTKQIQQREDIETKLESKIIKRRVLEKHLEDCVKQAKYLQQKGFDNETARSGRATTNKTSR